MTSSLRAARSALLAASSASLAATRTWTRATSRAGSSPHRAPSWPRAAPPGWRRGRGRRRRPAPLLAPPLPGLSGGRCGHGVALRRAHASRSAARISSCQAPLSFILRAAAALALSASRARASRSTTWRYRFAAAPRSSSWTRNARHAGNVLGEGPPLGRIGVNGLAQQLVSAAGVAPASQRPRARTPSGPWRSRDAARPHAGPSGLAPPGVFVSTLF